ncbi:MAG TPA: selenide, water dikinase SelD [Synechococcales cyanobacterium M55_K2018_004]|nr:selenide, water dikinase SelD [Synechococcales cyanobacterium M55_K2018_004]
MLSTSTPIETDLVFIGGGHSHAIALKKWGMRPLPGVRLTLISDVSHTPYSGMLPGYVAGYYTYDDCHIDLRPLATAVGARLILDRAIGLDLQHNRVICANHPAIAFDYLSIDIGSTPHLISVSGAAEHVIPVKPISQFLVYWEALVQQVCENPGRSLSLGVVGGGAGGVELALAIQARLQRIYRQAGQPPDLVAVHLFHRGRELMPERSAWVRRQLQRELEQRGIHLHLQETVSEVSAEAVRCESGLTVPCDRIFWVTQAAAAAWLRHSGLATDEQGFIQVSDTLQSISHPQVFAAGDVATMVNHPRPKAGVFAVRQGAPLAENLRRSLLQQPLQVFRPQTEFLILIGLGDRTAVASRGSFGCGPARWIWNWKDAIDRRFMATFTHLKPMSMTTPPASSLPTPAPTPPCAGCASKIGASVLARSLSRIQADFPDAPLRTDIVLGLAAPDDAAVVQVPAGQVMVQTVDYFRAIVNDPFVFGQIAANHCLSDLYAMGAAPQSALAIATLPYATASKHEEMLYQLLSGALKTLHAAGAVLVGGHTTEGTDLAFGLVCNGLAHPDRLLRKGGMAPGDVLILTKPLGTGTLFAADMQLQAKGRWIEAAIHSMLRSNQTAARILQAHGATACTDVTGFGLLGHLAEMVSAAGVAVEVELGAIPVLEGAIATTQQGYLSSLYPQNVQVAGLIKNLEQVKAAPTFPLLFDPQTCGGLLASIPAATADACLKALRQNGDPQSVKIGTVLQTTDESKKITIL